jgi:hypothetical protein
MTDAGRQKHGAEGQRAGPAGRCRRTLAALALLLAVVPPAWAASDCQTAFEKWAILSSARLRVVPPSESEGANGRGACVPTEAVRHELLEALARARGFCAELFDQSVQQTRTLLNINHTFIASLLVCHSGTADAPTEWVTKSAPAPERPKVAARPPAPPKPAVATPPPAPPCLEISAAQDDHYAVVNRRCRGHTVLAVIETRGPAGETVCRGYTISQRLAVRAPRATPPRVNHECVLSQGPCNKDRLGNMFPECDW